MTMMLTCPAAAASSRATTAVVRTAQSNIRVPSWSASRIQLLQQKERSPPLQRRLVVQTSWITTAAADRYCGCASSSSSSFFNATTTTTTMSPGRRFHPGTTTAADRRRSFGTKQQRQNPDTDRSKQDIATSSPGKFVLGGHKWRQLQQQSSSSSSSSSPEEEEEEPPSPQAVAQEMTGSNSSSSDKNTNYDDIVESALLSGVSTLEMGQGDDGAADAALCHALRQVHGEDVPDHVKENGGGGVQVLKRVGYRTVTTTTTTSSSLLPGDVQVEQMMNSNSNNNSNNNSGGDGQQPAPATSTTVVVHNMGPHGIDQALQESALAQAIVQADPTQTTGPGALVGRTHLTLQLHNPEVQGTLPAAVHDPTDNTSPERRRQARIRDKLVESMLHCEAVVADHGNPVRNYGIVSNGLSLPETHPLHLSWSETVWPALQQAQQELSRPLHLNSIALPLNLLETRGLAVAQQIRFDVESSSSSSSPLRLQNDLQLWALRPLTAYPDQGTGTSGHAFVLADYQLPAALKKELTWSNQMTAPPQVYQMAMQRAIRHFDDHAQEIIQRQIDGHDLDAEEREVIDGCKLMQSIIHDVDNGLEQVRSFRAHEEFLSQRIIPLMYDTFEGYDEETAKLLEAFFGCYSLAVRYSIARNTRQLLKQGEGDLLLGGGGSATPTYPDLPDDQRLQEVALGFLLSQTYESQQQQQQ
mmetsp:Transcript_21704/g.60289  ORF Transcript_21704/g.60289 Transcript_21704/m.60289 type:complete len:698 (-) Transcript_21704:904-2997(-)